MTAMTQAQINDMIATVTRLLGAQIYVGIPSDNADRQEPAEPTNSTIGMVMEFGEPAENIPARPFLVPGVRAGEEKIAKMMGKVVDAAIAGSQTDVRKFMNAAGLAAVSAIKARIVQGISPPLSQRTLAERRARGRTGTTPLIDTGQLLNSITYVIKEDA